jgi:hypothetical protein
MSGGHEERGYSEMKNLIVGYGREKMLGYTVLDNRLTDGCEVVSITPRSRSPPPPPPQEDFLVLGSVRGCVNPRANVRLEGFGK